MPDDHPSPWSLAGHRRAWAPEPPPSYATPAYAPEPYAPEPYATHPYAAGQGQLQAPPYAAYVAPRPVEVRLLNQPGSGRGLAVTGLVLGSLALLGVLVVLVVSLAALGFSADAGGGGTYVTPRGTLAPAKTGGLTGEALAAEVTRSVSVTGGVPEDVVCPDTAKVAQDVTTVCHGTDYGEEATFVVFFEDAKGTYTLLEI